MKNNVKIIIRRGMPREIQGPPQEVIRCALAVVAAVWTEHRVEDATPEELVADMTTELRAMLGRLGYPCRESTDEAEEDT